MGLGAVLRVRSEYYNVIVSIQTYASLGGEVAQSLSLVGA